MSSEHPHPGGSTKRLSRPVYELHTPDSPAVEVPTKKAYGVDSDNGPYAKWRIYNDFKPITRDQSSWPDEHTLLQDWHMPFVIESMTCPTRKERHPADFDGSGQIRIQRLPRGRAAKEEWKSDDDTILRRYLVYKNYYQLHGDEGAQHLKHDVRDALEDTHGIASTRSKGWTLGDVALVQADFTPTRNELKSGTDPFRFSMDTSSLPHAAQRGTTSKTSGPRNSFPSGSTEGSKQRPDATPSEKNATMKTSSISSPLPAEKNNGALVTPTKQQRIAQDSQAPTSKYELSTTDTSEGIFVKMDTDDKPDPFKLLVVADTSVLSSSSTDPTPGSDKFMENLVKTAKSLEVVDEARADAIHLVNAIHKFYQQEISACFQNQNENDRWVESCINRMQEGMASAVEHPSQLMKLKEVYNLGTKVKETIKSRREKQHNAVMERLREAGLSVEQIPVYLDLLEKSFPELDGSSSGPATHPRPILHLVHEAGVKRLVDELQMKGHLSAKPPSSPAGDEAPTSPQSESQSASVTSSAKRAAVSTEPEEPSMKRFCQ